MQRRAINFRFFAMALLAALLFFTSAGLAWATQTEPATQTTDDTITNDPTTPPSGYFIYDEKSDTFHTYGSQHNFRLTSASVTVNLAPATIDMQFLDANPDVVFFGQKPVQATANYFIGNNPAQWRKQMPMYTEVVYQTLYPGIDLIYTLLDGQLKSEFIVQPGADLDQIRIKYTNIASLSIQEKASTLNIVLPSGETLHEHIPSAYQNVNGRQPPIDVSFRLLDNHTYAFALRGAYDPEYPLVIDPIFIYGTYLGGNVQDEGWSIAVDEAGSTYISGITQSINFPMTLPGQHNTGVDVFVAKIDATGDLVYVSIFGGFSGEQGNGIAVDAMGNAYIAGETFSTDFPILNAWQPNFAGYEDAFVLKVDADGNLVYSTFLGGSRGDEINDIVADSIGNVYLGGEVYSDDFPLVNPWSSNVYGVDDEDCFISIINANGELVYSTYISAPQRDQIFRIAVDNEGYIYGTGMTSSPDFPLVNPLQDTYGGDWDDCFVFKLDPWNNEMVYSTFLGGAGRDECWGIAVDEEGSAYVTGFTLSSNFPVVNPVQAELERRRDAFIAKLSPEGDALVFSTYIGGSERDWAWDLGLDSGGNVYITGDTSSPDFPLLDALQPHYNANQDAFLLVLTSDGALKYSSFLGGSGNDRGWRLTVDENWIVHVTGSTASADFPLKNPYQSQSGGQADAFVTRFGLIPTPTPPPTPTPIPTPTPYAAAEVGPAGAVLWISYPGHITLLTIPENAITSPSIITLTYDGRSNVQGDLQGNNHFFSIEGHVQGDTTNIPLTQFAQPARLTLGYDELMSVISTTLDLHRLSASGWTTENITKVAQSNNYLSADIEWLGTYGLLGDTNRIYLPLTLRTP